MEPSSCQQQHVMPWVGYASNRTESPQCTKWTAAAAWSFMLRLDQCITYPRHRICPAWLRAFTCPTEAAYWGAWTGANPCPHPIALSALCPGPGAADSLGVIHALAAQEEMVRGYVWAGVQGPSLLQWAHVCGHYFMSEAGGTCCWCRGTLLGRTLWCRSLLIGLQNLQLAYSCSLPL